jgi:hypothetical protein
MKLLTNTLLERFQEIGSQRDVKDPIVIAKFFNPSGTGTWYLTEFNPDDQCFFTMLQGLDMMNGVILLF